MFKNTKTSPNALENSTMQGGGLEAQRVPDLLFQLMFAIGTEGLVVPNVNMELSGNYYCNPTKVILNACSAVCEMVWCLKTKSLLINQFKDLLLIINVANFHALSLKEALLNSNR